MVHLAAEAIGCTPQTVYNHIQRHPTVKQAWENEREKMLDIGELKLYEGVVLREQWAVTLLLKTKGKDRGYVERQELTEDVNVKITRLPTKAKSTEEWAESRDSD